MQKYRRYNLLVWLYLIAVILISILLYRLFKIYINDIIIIIPPILLLAYLGTGGFGASLEIKRIHADLPLFEKINNVYFKFLLRLFFTTVYCYILFQILFFITRSQFLEHYWIEACMP